MDEAGLFDDNFMRESLQHVIDGEGSDGAADQGLHLDTRFARGGDGAGDRDGVFVGAGRDLDLTVFDHEGVAKGDEVGGLLGRQHPSDDRRGGHGALLGDELGGLLGALNLQQGRHDVRRKPHDGAGGGGSASFPFL